jgi:hypothetical protein
MPPIIRQLRSYLVLAVIAILASVALMPRYAAADNRIPHTKYIQACNREHSPKTFNVAYDIDPKTVARSSMANVVLMCGTRASQFLVLNVQLAEVACSPNRGIVPVYHVAPWYAKPFVKPVFMGFRCI